MTSKRRPARRCLRAVIVRFDDVEGFDLQLAVKSRLSPEAIAAQCPMADHPRQPPAGLVSFAGPADVTGVRLVRVDGCERLEIGRVPSPEAEALGFQKRDHVFLPNAFENTPHWIVRLLRVH